MKTLMIAFSWCLVAGVMFHGALALDGIPEGTELVKISKERVPMDLRLVTLCVSMDGVVGPHDAAEVNVYVNDQVIDYRKKNPEDFDYPVGSVFVKEKFPSVGAAEPDLATIMVKKKDEGHVSDWEFSMVSLPDREPVRPNASVSCADCHERYEERGYISKKSEELLLKFIGIEGRSGGVDDAGVADE